MESLTFRAVPNTAGLFYVPNEDLDVDEMLKQPSPAIPPPRHPHLSLVVHRWDSTSHPREPHSCRQKV